MDFDGDREESASVTRNALKNLTDHAVLDDNDPVWIVELKETLTEELKLMDLVFLIAKCKNVVRYFKQSSHNLSKTLKQEIDVRRNTIHTMLRSIDDSWDEVSCALLLSRSHAF